MADRPGRSRDEPGGGEQGRGQPPESPGAAPGTGPGPPEPPEMEPDFATEHASPTFADQMPGGPEGVRELESPRGLAGMDPRRWFRRWRRRPRRG